jgi:hypothetical protein
LDFQDGENENIREAGNRCLIRSLLLGVQGKAKANPKALKFRMGTRQEIPGATTQLGVHMLEGEPQIITFGLVFGRSTKSIF